MKPDLLYSLIPSIYRERDAPLGFPLRDFLSALQVQAERIEQAIDIQYENWFIETCDSWAIPLIADLIAYPDRHLLELASQPRDLVAGFTEARQAMGTAATVEQVLSAVAGRDVQVRDFTGELAWIPEVSMLHPGQMSLPDITRLRILNPSLFDSNQGARLPVVEWQPRSSHDQSVGPVGGRYFPAHVGIFYSLLETLDLEKSTAFDHGGGRFSFDSLGVDVSLVAPVESTGDEQSMPFNVFLGASQNAVTELPRDQITFSNLRDWKAKKSRSATGKVLVDRKLGRLLLPDSMKSSTVLVSYSYQGLDDLGGGPYVRQASTVAADGIPVYDSKGLQQALNSGQLVLQLMRSAYYPLDGIVLPSSGNITLQAAPGKRPTLQGDLLCRGDAAGLSLTLRGLRIGGRVMAAGNLSLLFKDCTVRNVQDDGPSLCGVLEDQTDLHITAKNSILFGIQLPAAGAELVLERCIVDGRGHHAVYAHDPEVDTGPLLSAQNCTFFGGVRVRELDLVTRSLFAGRLWVLQTQSGTLERSSMPRGSRHPVCHECLPDGFELRFRSTRFGDPDYALPQINLPRGASRSSVQMSLGVYGGRDTRAIDSLLMQAASSWLPAGADFTVYSADEFLSSES